MPKTTMIVTLKVTTASEDGIPYGHPSTWDWVELVGPDTEFISATTEG